MTWCLQALRWPLMLSALLAGGAVAAPTQAASQHHIDTAAFFSPWDDIEAIVIDTVTGARRQVLVQAYLLTSRNIADALLAAHRRGVDVRVLADKTQAGRGGDRQLRRLAAAGVPVGLESRYAAAHNKVMVVDADGMGADGLAVGASPTLLTGSYNFTWSAQARNAENLLRLRGDRTLAGRYVANWHRHCSDAQPLVAATPVGAVSPRLCFETVNPPLAKQSVEPRTPPINDHAR